MLHRKGSVICSLVRYSDGLSIVSCFCNSGTYSSAVFSCINTSIKWDTGWVCSSFRRLGDARKILGRVDGVMYVFLRGGIN